MLCTTCHKYPAVEGDKCGYHTGHFQPADLSARIRRLRDAERLERERKAMVDLKNFDLDEYKAKLQEVADIGKERLDKAIAEINAELAQRASLATESKWLANMMDGDVVVVDEINLGGGSGHGEIIALRSASITYNHGEEFVRLPKRGLPAGRYRVLIALRRLDG